MRSKRKTAAASLKFSRKIRGRSPLAKPCSKWSLHDPLAPTAQTPFRQTAQKQSRDSGIFRFLLDRRGLPGILLPFLPASFGRRRGDAGAHLDAFLWSRQLSALADGGIPRAAIAVSP